MVRVTIFAACLMFAPIFTSGAMAQAAPVNPVSQEPFYAELIAKAQTLKATTEGFAATPRLSLLTDPAFEAYGREIAELTELNLKAHYDLKARGTDNDLKCVLMGVALDLPIRFEGIRVATTEQDLKDALEDMAFLLEDNVDVIRTPATVDSGLDCVIEFGQSE
ncbi:hypothetical protein [Asticcacaulis tiandongensis]|uniref:hypothetical protein n=1 Tax=Asticcacaulis tiandongensis TaxID=2565365 RepID=UPI00112709C3|nr:hypothetical protein [Asticcacaulis tiandongensis]